ncbi:MAG TPA: exo-alpha-sialidase [Thermoleophilia bacterium]|nr:exo-alpha-sialidase [Thermoleophilia bacterium]
MRSGLTFLLSGAQPPLPPYSSAGTLVFQHYERGAWRPGGTMAAFSDALPFIVRPSLGADMGLVSATAIDGPALNRLTVSSTVPDSGVGSADASAGASVLVTSGDVFAQSSRADGTSIDFSGSVVQQPFTSGGLLMSALSPPLELKTAAGSLLRVFTASHYAETVAAGNVYVSRDGGAPALLLHDPGKAVAVSALVRIPEGLLVTYMVRDSANQSEVHAARWDAELRTQTDDQTVVSMPGYDVQAYSTIRCDDGLLVMPFVYAATTRLDSGPWTLDVAVSDDDGSSWVTLDQPRTISDDAPIEAGIMEPNAVQVAPDEAAILFRCAAGYIGRVDLDLDARTLGTPYLTDLESPLAGLSALRLASGAIAVAWVGCKPSAQAPRSPRKVIVVGVSDDGLRSFSSLQIVTTSQALDDSMVTSVPYVHQPRLAEIDGRLDCAIDRVASKTSFTPYLYAQASAAFDDDVLASDGVWHDVSMAPGAQRLDVLAAFGPATFEADGMIDLQRTWSAPTVLPTGGRWRVRLAAAAGTSAWTPFVADQASFSAIRVSRGVVTFARRARLTARLLTADGRPLGSAPVEVLRDGRPVAAAVTSADGSVAAGVTSIATAHWSLHYGGTDSIAGVDSRALRTLPRRLLTLVVPASGTRDATVRLSKGTTYEAVARGRLSVALLQKKPASAGGRGARVRLTHRTSVFTAPLSGLYKIHVAMPVGGTFILW